MRHSLAGLALVLGAFASGTLAEDERGWHTIHQERGIQISAREEPGMALPRLRGQTKLRAPVLHVLAILLDDRRSPEWAQGADESEVIRTIDERTHIVYARSHQRWPVKDRDVVMKRTVDVIRPGQTYRVHLVCTPGERPVAKDAVRIRRCETTFWIDGVDANTTRVDYRFNADPGGNSPTWIVKAVSENIPLDTLRRLARQVERTRGVYDRTFAQLSRVR